MTRTLIVFSWETASTSCSKELFLNRKGHGECAAHTFPICTLLQPAQCRFKSPLPGIEQLLTQLQEQHIQVAVASNKYQEATEKLIRQYFPSIHFTAVFGQRENVPTKPDPQVIHEIIGISGVQKEEVVYIGDSGVDMQTGLNAGVTTIGVCWGFRPKNELEAFQPDLLVENPEEIADFLQLA